MFFTLKKVQTKPFFAFITFFTLNYNKIKGDKAMNKFKFRTTNVKFNNLTFPENYDMNNIDLRV